MVNLYSKKFTKNDLLKKIGDISQIARVRHFELLDGNEKGVEVAQIHTGSGLIFDILLGRGMDISYAGYKGIPLSWRSATGDVAASYFEPEEFGWLRNFHGGLLNTCGLTYAGAPCEDEGKKLGLHGRISNTPAKNIYIDGEWQDENYILFVKGKIKETSVFGENICLTREISVKTGESRLFLYDRVENLGYSDIEHMILYHINIGFPIIDEGSVLVSPTEEVIPRDEEAKIGKEDYYKFTLPIHGFKEKVYYHKMKPDQKGNVCAAIINKKFNNGEGLGVYVKYSIKELPYFIEWKMMNEGTYVVGMEPSNCLVEGRNKERKEKRLKFLKPGEIKEYHLEIGVIEGKTQLSAFK